MKVQAVMMSMQYAECFAVFLIGIWDSGSSGLESGWLAGRGIPQAIDP